MSVLAEQNNKTPEKVTSAPAEQPQTTQKLRPVFLPKVKQNLAQKKVPVFKPFSQPALTSNKGLQQKSPASKRTFQPKPVFTSNTKVPVFGCKTKPSLPKPSIPQRLVSKPSLPKPPVLSRQPRESSGESGYESMVPPSSVQLPATPRQGKKLIRTLIIPYVYAGGKVKCTSVFIWNDVLV